MIRLDGSSELARSSAPRVTPLRQAMLASASPATTTYSEAAPVAAAVVAVVVVEATTPVGAAGVAFTRAPAGITSDWPGWITLVSCSEFTLRSSDSRTP